MVEILGRYICLCNQEVINNAASGRSHGKGILWSLPSGGRGIMRHLCHGGSLPGTDSESETMRGGLRSRTDL